jgi:SlyX protein
MQNENLNVLESRLTWLENTVADLNNVVVEQAKSITKLQERLDALSLRYRELRDLSEEDIPSRRPPHY